MVLPGDTTLCNGKSITLTATVLNSTGTNYFQWSTGSRLQSIIVTPTTTTTYRVTVRTSVFSSIVTSMVVTVNTTFQPVVSPNQLACKGTPTTLVATGGTDYSWSPTGLTTSGIIVSPLALKIYTVTIKDNTCSAVKVIVVRISPTPTLNEGSDITICYGSRVNLVATGTGSTYTWSDGQFGSSVYVAPTETTTYIITATSASGCQTTKDIVVTLNNKIVVDAGIDQTICNGAYTTLSATGGQYYEWSTGSRNSTITVNPTTTTTFVVSAYSNTTGCFGTDDVIVNLIIGIGV